MRTHCGCGRRSCDCLHGSLLAKFTAKSGKNLGVTKILALLLLVLSAPAWAELRVALVIGNGAYRAVPQLANPPLDAAAVSARLKRLGFQVTEGIDLGKAAMDDLVRKFGEQAGQADVAVVFYAGHGIQVSGRNYLVPVDAKLPTREQDLRYDFVDVVAIMDELVGVKRLRVVMLDACRDNPIAAGLNRSLGRSLDTSRGLAAPAGLDNTLIAYATAADATASDGSGTNSPFTRALLDHIDDPGLDVRLMFGRVRDEVRRATNNKQNPFVYVSMGGENFAFNAGPAPGAPSSTQASPPPSPSAPAAVPAPLPPPPTAALVAPPRAPEPPALAPQPSFQPQQSAAAQSFANEDYNFGVPTQSTLQANVGSPTPLSIPGARTVSTGQVAYEIRQNRRMVLVDALDNNHTMTIAGAVYLPKAGHYGSFSDQVQYQLTRDLAGLTQGKRDTPLVFFCLGVQCWESYNAALRAVVAGYPNVFWYRGGLQSWSAAGYPMRSLGTQ